MSKFLGGGGGGGTPPNPPRNETLRYHDFTLVYQKLYIWLQVYGSELEVSYFWPISVTKLMIMWCLVIKIWLGLNRQVNLGQFLSFTPVGGLKIKFFTKVTKSCPMLYSCIVIILFNTDLFKYAFSSYSLKEKAFCLSVSFVFCLLCF